MGMSKGSNHHWKSVTKCKYHYPVKLCKLPIDLASVSLSDPLSKLLAKSAKIIYLCYKLLNDEFLTCAVGDTAGL